MTNYKIKKMKDKFQVIEIESEFIIRTYDEHKEANKYMRFLEKGGGFNGMTPEFVIKQRSNDANNNNKHKKPNK